MTCPRSVGTDSPTLISLRDCSFPWFLACPFQPCLLHLPALPTLRPSRRVPGTGCHSADRWWLSISYFLSAKSVQEAGGPRMRQPYFCSFSTFPQHLPDLIESVVQWRYFRNTFFRSVGQGTKRIMQKKEFLMPQSHLLVLPTREHLLLSAP